MNMVVQGTAEWRADRLGKVTASRVADVVRKTKSGYSSSRANYMAQLVCERLTGAVAEGFTSVAMEWGTQHEPDARAAYEFLTDCEIELVGSIDHPSIQMASGSPDGFVGTDGMIEMKCPLTATHIDTLLGKSIPADYETQMLWNMACNPTRKWCDFVSFDPRLPESMRLFVKRVHRNNSEIARLEDLVIQFLRELDQKTSELIRIYEPDFPSGAVASAAASDEGSRAKAAPPQHGDTDMGGAAQPAKQVQSKLPKLTGLLAERHRDNLIRQIRSLDAPNDFPAWGRDGDAEIARLPDAMAEEVRAEFASCKNRVGEMQR